MILGRITGKVSTNSFRFEIKGNAKKFGYVQVSHPEYGFVLGQILEIERTAENSIAICNVLGFRDSNKILRGLRTPFEPGIEVLRADDDFVKKTLGLELAGNGAYMGVLDGRNNLKVHIDLDTLITKHVFITGKSGSGKSYAVAVILEALLDGKVPLVIIDPHGEYNSFGQPSDNLAKLQEFELKPKAYLGQIDEYSPDIEANPTAKALKLNSQRLTPNEMIKLLPTKLSNSQLGILYSALKNLGNEASFDDLIFELESSEESSAKWTLINMLEYVKRLDLFSDNGTLPSELVNLNKCSIINLRGIPPEVQEVIVYKLANDLFMERKRGNISPFFLVIEEAQNYCPERGFGEAKSNAIIRQIAAEGRKFGMGLAVISQRPSRLDKCLHPETEVISDKNEIINLEELSKQFKKGKIKQIFAYDFKTKKIILTKIKGIKKNNNKEKIYCIKTGRGYEIKCTGDHRLFTINNGEIIEKEASKLTEKDLLIITKKIKIKEQNNLYYDKKFLKELNKRKKIIKNRIKCYNQINNYKNTFLSKKYNVSLKTINNWRNNIQKPAYLDHINLLNKDYIFGKNLMKKSQPIPLIYKVTPELSRFFAFLIAESDEVISCSYSIRFTNKNLELVKQFEKISKNLFNLNAKVKYWKNRKIYTANLYNILLKELFEKLGHKTGLKSKERDIPSFILNSNLNCIKAFLQSYFDCDGGVTKAGVVVTSSSYKIIKKISFLLKRFPIEHTIYKKKQLVNNSDYFSWQIIILTRELLKFSKEIGFFSTEKKKKLINLIKTKKNAKKKIIYDYIPFTKKQVYSWLKLSKNVPKIILNKFSKLPNNLFLHVETIKKILPYLNNKYQQQILHFINSDIRTDKIKSIFIEKPQISYDIETEHKNFIANQILSHNSVISQVSTQVILKVTNPNDIKAITNSVEGMTFELENELQNIPIGTALITGVIDLPLFVNIRPRRTKHGGEAVKIFSKPVTEEEEVDESNLMLLIQPKMTARDIELMSETPVKVTTKLAPCVMLRCNQGSEDFNLLIDLNEAKIITNVEKNEGFELSKIKLYDISEQQNKIFQTALKLGSFKPSELFSQSGVQFSDLYDLITVLVQKGYLEQEGENYKVSGPLQQFSNLQKLAIYQKPEFVQCKHDGMLDKIVGVDAVKTLFVKFSQVKSVKECWLVKHIVQ